MAQLSIQLRNESCFERVNRLADERKVSHHQRMTEGVVRQAERYPAQFAAVRLSERTRPDWWADTDLWLDPGHSPSEVEHDTYFRLFRQSWSIEVNRLKVLERRPVKVVKPWKPLFELHVEQLLALIVVVSAGGAIRIFAANDLTESEVAVG